MRFNYRNLSIIIFLGAIIFPSFLVRPAFSQEILEPNLISEESLLNPNTKQIFVYNSEFDSIVIYDPEAQGMIARLPTGGQGPALITVDDDGNFYVKNHTSSDITVFPGLFLLSEFDRETVQQLIRDRIIIPVADTPVSIALNTELRRLYVFSSTEGILTTIDTQTFQVIATKQIEPGVGRISVNPNTQKIYVILSGENKLYIVDENTNETIKTLTFEKNIYTVVLNRLDDNVLLLTSHGGGIYVVSGQTDELFKTVEYFEGPRYARVDIFYKKIYVINYIVATPAHKTTIGVLDAETYELLAENILPHDGLHPKDFVIDFLRNLIYLADPRTNTAFVIDGEDYEVLATLKTGLNPGRPLLSPQTGKVVFTNFGDDTTTIISQPVEGEFQAETLEQEAPPTATWLQERWGFFKSKNFYIPTAIVLLVIAIYFGSRYFWLKRLPS